MKTQLKNKQVSFSESGWLENREDWNDDIAVTIAKSVDIELTKEHWELVHIAREYYEAHHTCCPSRAFSRILRQKNGEDHCDQKYIYQLFPAGGLVHCINKIAGLPCPCDGSF